MSDVNPIWKGSMLDPETKRRKELEWDEEDDRRETWAWTRTGLIILGIILFFFLLGILFDLFRGS
jgi:hypothetical protein